MMMRRWYATAGLATVLLLTGGRMVRAAEPAVEPQLVAACESMRAQLVAAGQDAIADELVKQFDAYLQDPAFRDEVHQSAVERMNAARREFAQRYARLVAEGRQADADRLLKLFTAYVKDTP